MTPPKPLSPTLSASPQLDPAGIPALAAAGFRAIIGNRFDGEEPGQPSWSAIEAAARGAGLQARHVPVKAGSIGEADVARFRAALEELPGPVLAFCRTGTRSAMLWALANKGQVPSDELIRTAGEAGFDITSLQDRLAQRGEAIAPAPAAALHDVVIVGGGAGGIAAAASLLRRRGSLDIAIVEPRESHYYQPGWTLVGAGIFEPGQTVHREADVIPRGVTWLKTAAAGFAPETNSVRLADGSTIRYRLLIVATGNRLAWEVVDGLADTLGQNGVTSNYSFDTAPYTWDLVRKLKRGRALFTQPPMPIKCAGAPQKAMYLSCHAWERAGVLGDIDVQFHTAGAAIFGVQPYVPALMETVHRYGIDVHLGSNLVAVDGPARQATFKTPDGETATDFDLLHVTPPQRAVQVVADSPLADETGYVEVDQETLRHKRFPNVFALGDAGSMPNAKTAAAVRKQAPVVAINALAVLDGREPAAIYEGYGSCPLTVEAGRILLAEFGYGGALQPTFPKWLFDGTRPSRLAWILKKDVMPAVYWDLMLKGREWLVRPKMRDTAA
jgi:sulfide:quinone oxidoreductase